MRLCVYGRGGDRRVGVALETEVIDLTGPLGWLTIDDMLRSGGGAMDDARRIADSGDRVALADVTLHAPIHRPSKFLAIAANYQSHIDEVLAANPDYVPPVYQRWFTKLPSCINDPFAPILMAPEARDFDYEAELAIVIGRRCRRVKAEEAAQVVAGYMICNDVSVRDWQKRSPTIMLGKSFDTHGPIGPWLVTPDEIGDPHTLGVRCLVNGEVRQNGSTSEMINNCWEQIEYLSTVCTLEPGDIIATGTPKGTGAGLKPPRPLKAGDVVRCEVDRIGAIEAVMTPEEVAA